MGKLRRYLQAGAILAEALDNLQDLRDRYTVNNNPTIANSPFGNCLKLNGDDQNVNLGDVVELNAISAFTIALWVAQDVVDATDVIFRKHSDDTHEIYLFTGAGAQLYFIVRDGDPSFGRIADYGPLMSAQEWHHLAFVFDGSGAANADRMKIYVDGVSQTLQFNDTVPAATADLSGVDAYIGYTGQTWDGKFRDFLLFNRPLSVDELLDLATHKAFDY